MTAAEKILNQTKLSVKAGVEKKTALDKLADITKQYQNLRYMIE